MLFSNANNDPSAELGTKELQKLRRQDLLEFLLDQMVENDTLRDTLAEREASIRDLSSMAERLKAKLDDKDAQIEHLKGKLDEKDVQIERLKKKLNEKDALIERLKFKLDAKDQTLEDAYAAVRGLATVTDALEHTQQVLLIESILSDNFLLGRHQAAKAQEEAHADADADAEGKEEDAHEESQEA